MAKRIAQIILPKAFNDGKSTTWLHHAYQTSFANVFGGYTAIDVRGGWIGPDGRLFTDESVAYHIAIDDMQEMSFLAMAQTAAKEFQQLAIFVVRTNGDVEFISGE